MAIGPPEIAVILIIFFLLFGAERLPKLARSMGQAKGEFQEGLNEVVHIPEKKKTFTDLDAGGMTPEQKLAEDARRAGIDPVGKDTDSIKEELQEKE
ncbi:MAG: twin-arginine translocase TatA/TatE family subunit [Methanobacteriota archaeon]|nr:MAG: twin-arginine translocase TatA/TatE family subunit [Euryarchaeota archaeon]|tara:strand:- start:1412 stop:1702 length:291 start_codon:yes stop_codon:yes gene_type:complete